MGLMKSHKLLLAIGLAATVWYHWNKRKAPADVAEREGQATEQYAGGDS